MFSASFLFALMGVCVKLAAEQYSAEELVFYRSLVGLLVMAAVMRWQGVAWRTQVPAMHFWRSASGTTALCMWFYAIAGLPLATAMTLNYMSSVWIALFIIGGAVLVGGQRGPDGRLIAAVLAGFVGVALVLRPTIDRDQLWHGVVGLGSGMLAAVAYLQVTALGRVGEPGSRVVLYFSISGVLMGAALAVAMGGLHRARWARRAAAVGDRPAGHRCTVDDDLGLRDRRHLGHRGIAVPGHRLFVRLRRLALP
jgi:S-adenosylmethionine uptake transporter